MYCCHSKLKANGPNLLTPALVLTTYKSVLTLQGEAKTWPTITDSKEHAADADDWKEVKEKLKLLER